MSESDTGQIASIGETSASATATRGIASFETGLQELELIVKEMESTELPLERALELFEKGVKLSETCRRQLEEAETRIEILTRRGDKVQPTPFRPDQARTDKL